MLSAVCSTSPDSSASDSLPWKLQSAQSLCERFAAQQQSLEREIPVQPLQSGAAQGERVCDIWFPAQDVKSQQGGHSLPIREIKQDMGPKSYSNQHQGSLDSGGGRAAARDRHHHHPHHHSQDCTGTELMQTKREVSFKCIHFDWQVWWEKYHSVQILLYK